MYLALPGVFGVLGPLGWPEIILILVVVMLLFGAKRLPDLARGFGKSIREFKKATTEVEEDVRSAVEDEPPSPKNGATGPAKKVAKTEEN